MENYLQHIKTTFANGVQELFGESIDSNGVLLSQTRKEVEGDYTIVLFPYVKSLKKSPVELGDSLGQYLVDNIDYITEYNVIKGFLNVAFSHGWWKGQLEEITAAAEYGRQERNGKKVMVEFSSPNTNKPLHLGHIRNILLGWSASQIMDMAGYDVIKTQIINDRGIAVCKSMLAWQKYGNGDTPESTGIKGDHFVGKYYVRFDQAFQEEYKTWQETDTGKAVCAEKKKEGDKDEDFFKAYKNAYFNEYSALGAEAKQMLLKWEANDEAIRALWSQMNGWVYDGFDVTYDSLGVDFDKLYYESDTYILGKEAVAYGLEKGVFEKEADGSVWCDLTDIGMDRKIVLRADGTAVYMTQDIGTAMIRNKDFGMDSMIYVVGNEQEYHFKVLFEILKRLGEPYAEKLHHLSYGMVDLPSGRMKSREGTVVDADDLVAEVIAEAGKANDERGDIEMMTAEEKQDTLRKIGLAALKYFIIKVQPKKGMTFNPKESVDMQGQTGPYIQNAYVRIQSVLRKFDENTTSDEAYAELNEFELTLLKQLIQFPETVLGAAKDIDPSSVANYCYELAKSYHRFYHEVRILSAETEAAKSFRLKLSKAVAEVLESGMRLLGIEMPERM